jgi:hypothetical protein
MEKIFNQKNFNYFVWTPLFLPSSSLSGICSLILFPLFATGVVDTGGKFAAGIVDTGGNLPPVSLIPVANLLPVSLIPVAICHRQWQFATGVVDTSGKFAAGIVDTGSKFATSINNTSKNGGKICRRCR